MKKTSFKASPWSAASVHLTPISMDKLSISIRLTSFYCYDVFPLILSTTSCTPLYLSYQAFISARGCMHASLMMWVKPSKSSICVEEMRWQTSSSSLSQNYPWSFYLHCSYVSLSPYRYFLLMNSPLLHSLDVASRCSCAHDWTISQPWPRRSMGGKEGNSKLIFFYFDGNTITKVMISNIC